MPTVNAINTRKEFKDFVTAPARIYQDDPYWVRQLDFERLTHLSPANPYFNHAKTRFFVCRDAHNNICGRISAQIDELAQKEGSPLTGHFGFVDATNEENLHALIDQAEDWLRQEGAEKAVGPFSLSINDESGLLVEGFNSPPALMMNYAKKWYEKGLRRKGYQKAMDLLAYDMDIHQGMSAKTEKMADKAFQIDGLTERPLNPKNMEEDLRIILDIYNDAWAENWGFVKMTPPEVSYMAKSMKPLLVPELARIIEINGKPAAMIVALPDMNEAIKDLNGQVLPFGWAKLLWRLKIQGLSRARVMLMGIRQDWRKDLRSSAIAALLVQRLHQSLKQNHFKSLEMSWILEDNHAMCKLIETLGGTVYKRYRIFEKDLT